MNFKNILLTGSSGMMGSNIKKVFTEYNIVMYDIQDGQDIREFNEDLTNIDVVIHCAAKAGVKESVENKDLYYDINVNGTKRIFEVCKQFDKPIIYMSSSNAKNVTNPYAETKKLIEELSPKNSIGIRPHALYPGRKDMLFWQLQNTNNIKYINANHSRDFTHIIDFCNVLKLILQNYNKYKGKILDIGSGKIVNILEVATIFNWTGEIRTSETPYEMTTMPANIEYYKKLNFKLKYSII